MLKIVLLIIKKNLLLTNKMKIMADICLMERLSNLTWMI